MNEIYRKACRHLARKDSVLRNLIAQIGPCTLRVDPDPFPVLVRAIVSQMLSTKAARTIYERIELNLDDQMLTPERVVEFGLENLRRCGLSGSKARAILDLAGRIIQGLLPIQNLPEMNDQSILERLQAIQGIGRWTAEMFLIFSLGRLDILPVADLGLRAGVKDCYGLSTYPTPKELTVLSENWKPFRTVATWYFWKSRGWVPQSEK